MEKPPIKICMISCLHGLYDDRIYWKEALSLKKNGYDVTHIAVGETGQQYTSEHGILLIEIKNKRFFANHFIDKLFRLITFKPPIYKKLFQKCAELKADVYHFHDLQLNRIAPKLKKLPHQPKVIYDVHEPYPITLATTSSKNPFNKLFWWFYGRYIEFWEKTKSKHYDLIITTEENVQKFFKEKLKSTSVEIIYNYVDIKPKDYSRLKIYDFIYCGGIRKRRGIFEILSAVKILHNKGIHSKTLLIGHIHDPGLEREIYNFIQEHDLMNAIEIKQVVPYQQIHEFYEGSKIGLAIFNDEKVNRLIMPIKIFEYIVFGLPVITSNFGHMKEITEENKTGILVDPHNYYQIAETMESLLTNSELYNRIYSDCVHSANKFNWSVMEKKIVDLYYHLLNKK
jgi:glycosyltransferase involved in cell wall biosynthesis